MFSRLTLRARITIGSTLVAILLLGLTAVIVFAQLSSVVAEKERAVLHGITEVYRGVIEGVPAEKFEPPGPKQHVAVLDPDGTVRINTLPEGLHDRLAEIIAQGPRLHSVSSAHETFYVYVDPVTTDAGTWYVIATRDQDIAEEVIDDVTHLLIAVLVVSAVVFTAGSWIVAGAALRPVERMRRSAESLAVANRGELLPTGPARDELGALSRTLNDLLERMRAASDRERQMVSDASHEMRNPLAVLRAQLELIDGSDAATDAAVVDDARRTLARLSRIADSLLQLSRIDAARELGATTLADAAAVVTDAVDRARLRAVEAQGDRTVDLDYRVDATTPERFVWISADDLGRILDNLIENALSATDGDVEILVTLSQRAETATLTVRDDAGGFAPEVADRAFERFTRGTSSYSGGGLGLAIVARLAERAGGAARIENEPGVGASVLVDLPVTASDPLTAVEDRSPNTHQR
ncbi:MAG: HAMP domain-containing histidine kinase [Microbacterium sp.]|nr:HAMP domain-containing histidine kinase [Microbacterium sp.]